jgi:hypothetical protein
VIHIVPGPTVEIRRERGEPRWCFGCRKRLAGDWVLLDDPPERQPSYYDPVWVWRCDGCNRDRSRFPA